MLLGEIVIEDDQPPVEPETPPARIPPTPMQVKRVLDEALLDAGVQFLYSCYVTDVLRDGDGKLAGIVMANRSGRQAVRAKVIIDATPRATVARIAGAAFEPFPAGVQTFKRIVVGDGVVVRQGPADEKDAFADTDRRRPAATGGRVHARDSDGRRLFCVFCQSRADST